MKTTFWKRRVAADGGIEYDVRWAIQWPQPWYSTHTQRTRTPTAITIILVMFRALTWNSHKEETKANEIKKKKIENVELD